MSLKSRNQPLAEVQVVVREATGRPYSHAQRVTLRRNDQEYQLRPFESSLGVYVFHGRALPGRYVVTVDSSSGAFHSEVELTYPGRTVTLAIGTDKSSNGAGDSLYSFDPDPTLIAITFSGFMPSKEIIEEVEKSIRLAGVSITPEAKSYRVWENVRLYRIEHPSESVKVGAALTTLNNPRVRAGVVMVRTTPDAGDEVWRISDGEFVICLPDNSQGTADSLLAQRSGTHVLRRLRHAGRAWLIETDLDQLSDMVALLDRLREQGKIRYWEPNYMERVVAHQLPVLPVGDAYAPGRNLLLQKVDKAWDALRPVPRALVWIATIDKKGIDPNRESVRTNLKFGYDFDNNGAFNRQTLGDGSHGMAVYGIISSSNAGREGVCGIAPEAGHVALKFSSSHVVTFSEILLWLAGLSNGEPPFVARAGIPNGALKQPIDVISLSFGVDTPIPETLSDTLQMLLIQGRRGKGTIIVCSAGNDNKEVTWLADDVRTITVSNTRIAEDNKEVIHASNFGLSVDLCAQGEGCMSLDLRGRAPFTGTSAAAPMVAATVALMLSANPELTFHQVRDILRSTAIVIDEANGKWGDDPVPDSWKDYRRATFSGGRKRQFSQYYGYGRLDVEAAVRLALELKRSVRRTRAQARRTVIPTPNQ